MDKMEGDNGRLSDSRANDPGSESGPGAGESGERDPVQMSRHAVAAGVLGVLSILLLPGLIVLARHPLIGVYLCLTLLVSLSALLFGVTSLGQIGLGGGRLVGKGFAWIGVSTPIVQVLLFLGVIVPLGPRSVAYRMTCGTNLSGIGKAMLLYANDYQDEFPHAGGRGSVWGQTPDWMAASRYQAYGLRADGSGGTASINSCLYLLVKYTEVTPKIFLCRGRREEKGVTEFRLSTYRLRDKRLQLTDLWDFGPNPAKHCNYAYQMVYSPYALTTDGQPNMAIAGDRNPWMDAPAARARDFSLFTPEVPPFQGTSEQARQGNTSRHEGDGQNVMFLDTHVDFQKRPYCGLTGDNIYTFWDGVDKIRGRPPQFGSQPAGENDSLLVNDPPALRK